MDVRYVLGGKETNVELKYVTIYNVEDSNGTRDVNLDHENENQNENARYVRSRRSMRELTVKNSTVQNSKKRDIDGKSRRNIKCDVIEKQQKHKCASVEKENASINNAGMGNTKIVSVHPKSKTTRRRNKKRAALRELKTDNVRSPIVTDTKIMAGTGDAACNQTNSGITNKKIQPKSQPLPIVSPCLFSPPSRNTHVTNVTDLELSLFRNIHPVLLNVLQRTLVTSSESYVALEILNDVWNLQRWKPTISCMAYLFRVIDVNNGVLFTRFRVEQLYQVCEYLGKVSVFITTADTSDRFIRDALWKKCDNPNEYGCMCIVLDLVAQLLRRSDGGFRQNYEGNRTIHQLRNRCLENLEGLYESYDTSLKEVNKFDCDKTKDLSIMERLIKSFLSILSRLVFLETDPCNRDVIYKVKNDVLRLMLQEELCCG